jgi:small subunit ribosomal protein S11
MKVAVLNIFSTKKNTLITVTDPTGTLTYKTNSAGMETNKDREKTSESVTLNVLENTQKILKANNIEALIVRIRAPGGIKPTRSNASLTLLLKNISLLPQKILVYEKTTPVPHDGTKRMYGRRGRRV